MNGNRPIKELLTSIEGRLDNIKTWFVVGLGNLFVLITLALFG